MRDAQNYTNDEFFPNELQRMKIKSMKKWLKSIYYITLIRNMCVQREYSSSDAN